MNTKESWLSKIKLKKKKVWNKVAPTDRKCNPLEHLVSY